ncbi:EamA family transporter [Nocardia sp. NPDC050175]|uniref:EamA family transporter n=1 Tax=Nocardia sp. NPDC050175 TaxID=3364317 RepID=UPI00378919DE
MIDLPIKRFQLRGVQASAAMGIVAMLSVQTGAAVSTSMFPLTGTSGAAWLRLLVAAVVLMVAVRPRLRGMSLKAALYVCGLGVMSAFMTISYFGAISRIPLGTASCLEYLGPFVVAVIGLRTRRDLMWPVLAVLGVVLVSQPWHDGFDAVGVLLGVAAGACLGGYVVLSQRVGDSFEGFSGLAIAMVVACVVTGFFGAPDALDSLDIEIIGTVLVSAILLPLLPYILEMVALRGMTTGAFSMLMSFEPALACLIGFIILNQTMSIIQLAGVVCIVLAGTAAVRLGDRLEASVE